MSDVDADQSCSWRFSLRGLLLLVTVVAIVLAALTGAFGTDCQQFAIAALWASFIGLIGLVPVMIAAVVLLVATKRSE